MTSKLNRAVAGIGAAIMITAGAGAALAAPADTVAGPTDAMLYIAGELTAQYDLPAGLILAVCETESDFDPSCRTGSCVGLMQLHSAYAGAFARDAGMESYDLRDPEDNMRIGAHLLSEYLRRYEGDIHMALMCYNLGEAGALRKLADGIGSTGYSRKVVGRIEKWAQTASPSANSPAPATQEESTEASRTPENAGTAAQAIRAAVTGVWQRLKEVLFR